MKELKRVVVKPYDKDRFELMEDYAVEDLRLKNTSLTFIIKKGFKTDGASIPRLFWSLYPPYRSEYFTAALIHDYLCLNSFNFKHYKNADEALRLMMKMLGCNPLKCFIFYYSCLSFHFLKCVWLRFKEGVRNAVD